MTILDGESLTIEKIAAVARGYEEVSVSEKAKGRIESSRKTLEHLVEEGQPIYGVTTGFGAFANKRIPSDQLESLQLNLVRSTAAGVGNDLPTEVVRGMMTMRANTLSKGFSGIRYEVVALLAGMLNERVHPIIPMKGSVGASGDLAPLAHMALCMLGEGEAILEEKRMPAGEALHSKMLRPLELSFKEGIALINGTEMMTSIGALAVLDAENLVRAAEIAAAMSIEAAGGRSDAFDPRIHAARPHAGQKQTAENIRLITQGSKLLAGSKATTSKNSHAQDAYSLRCTAQITGPSRDMIRYVRGVIETELNSVTDNPLVFTEQGDVVSGGNFHGQPISMALDALGIAVANLGNISERRVARLLDEKLSNGLPAFLSNVGGSVPGLHSGYMVAQYTSASLVSQNKILASPASVDSIPTSANQEDVNSMGSIAAHKAREIVGNVQLIIAVELLVASQALEFREPEAAGVGTRAAYKLVRDIVPHLEEDREISHEIQDVCDELVKSGKLVGEVRTKLGQLN